MEMYIDNQETLVKEHDGEIIAVQDGKFLGAYPTKLAACRAMLAQGKKEGEYVVIECSPGDTAYTSYWINYIFAQD